MAGGCDMYMTLDKFGRQRLQPDCNCYRAAIGGTEGAVSEVTGAAEAWMHACGRSGASFGSGGCSGKTAGLPGGYGGSEGVEHGTVAGFRAAQVADGGDGCTEGLEPLGGGGF